ncbi:MAG TPA: DUF5657 family protein [Patescibacteria group bacterium]|nr:DUF5657 family protein [Patescibacteria group bacterium]
MFDFPSIFDSLNAGLYVKIAVLIVLGLFVVFTFVIFNQTSSLNKILSVKNAGASTTIRVLALGYLIASISLFVLALVIL